MPEKMYLKPKGLRTDGIHTHYAADRAVRTNSNDPLPTLHRIDFVFGVATNVPDELAHRMEAEGIASRTRPRTSDHE